jgi:glycosyltransferase involved in cell wall biosynthesis
MELHSMPFVTAAVCTHNRSCDVERCLADLAPQAREYGIPVLVVDSGSHDDETQHLAQIAARSGARLVRCDLPGLSIARNRAMAEADSEWVVFLDDDTIPHADWAQGLVATLAASEPNIAIVGGRIVPRWPDVAATERVTDRWLVLLSCFDKEGAGRAGEGFKVCGANLAVRKRTVEMAGGFPVALGRTGVHLISGEEAYLIERLKGLDLASRYDSAFGVDHVISPERLEPAWAAQRAYWEGVSRVRLLGILGKAIPRHLSVPKLLLTMAPLFAMNAFSRNVDYAIRYFMARGALAEQLSLSRELAPRVRIR